MTDQNPSPTTRMPVPESADPDREGASGTTDTATRVWPVLIIGIGLWVVLGSLRRGSR